MIDLVIIKKRGKQKYSSEPLYSKVDSMKATLYLPSQPPQSVALEGLILPNSTTNFAHVSEQLAMLLGCAPKMVDVLASGLGYVAYSVFDSEDEVNVEAMAAVSKISGVSFDQEDEDTILRGAILIAEESSPRTYGDSVLRLTP